MTTTALPATNLTLLDWAKRTDPNGAIANVVELLSQSNAVLEDAVWKEGNLPTGHVFTSRTALPTVSFRKYNEGVAPSKSKTDQITETCGMIEGNSKVDCKLAEVGGQPAAFRASEDMGFMQAFNKQLESSLIYESTKTAPERMMGLAPRMDATTNASGGKQIILADASASGADQSSIWLVCWGDESVFGIFPKGSKAGVQAHDMGEQLTKDSGGTNEFRAYVTNWCLQFGLCVKDYRQLVRIANVDTGNLVATTDTIITSMIKAYHQIFNPKMGRLAYYVNRTVATWLHLQAVNNTKQSTITIERIGGQPVTMFLGIPVRTTDGILNTEATIS